MRLVLMSDTHIPGRARRLPAVVLAAVAEADVVVHAGDWVGEQVLDELLGASRSLVGCVGNNDGPALRRRLPQVARTELDGVRIGVVHETGDAARREVRCSAAYPDVDVLVFGHSHIPWDTTAPNGLRLLNPGSPTDRRRQPYGTFVTAVADGGALREVTFHEVPR